MEELVLNNFLDVFSKLELKKKIEILSKMTNLLKSDFRDPDYENKDNLPPSNEDKVIEQLFGVWKDEEALQESNIIDRTISNKDINLN